VDNDETITVHMTEPRRWISTRASRSTGTAPRSVDQNEVVTALLASTHTIGVNEAITMGATMR
jgi:hypothetical protein